MNSVGNKTLQLLLNSLGNGNLKVDGIVGRRTASAFLALDADRQRNIRKILSQLSIDWEMIDQSASSADFEIAGLASEVGLIMSVDPSMLLAKAMIESSGNPNAHRKGSPYYGLTQMGEASWNEARPYVENAGEKLGDFWVSWADPRQSLLAAAGYSISLELAARDRGYEGVWDASSAYLSHQQGARGFVEIWDAAQNGTELSSLRSGNMYANPPQDGRGATTSPLSFINRWKAVVERQVSDANLVLNKLYAVQANRKVQPLAV